MNLPKSPLCSMKVILCGRTRSWNFLRLNRLGNETCEEYRIMRYEEVVKKAKEEIADRLAKDTYKSGSVTYIKCDAWMAGDQINLWTYWQGHQIKDLENGVDIMLVGQDWGNPSNNDACDRIKLVREKKLATCYDENTKNPTDKHLVRLFRILDCDITKADPKKRLFFTNYSLGYRKDSEQGGMTKSLMKQDQQLFRDLVDAIKPRCIICLGRMTYECVIEETIKGGWKNQLETGRPFVHFYPGSSNIKVYGVAHCGARGWNNIGGEENNVKAWKAVAKDYKETYG